MNKKKLKKRIKELEDERDSYGIKTMLAYVEIEELKEQLTLTDVSQQRELLVCDCEFERIDSRRIQCVKCEMIQIRD